MENLSLIIQTKLNRPYAPQDLIPRSKLIARLNRGRQRPLTLVIAPAGYGKSTLLSHWLETLASQPTAWLSLEENDDDLVTFLTYFVAAVQKMFPHIGQETMALLSLTETTPHRVLLATLINELHTIEEDYVLVIDDYHIIQDPSIQQFMVEFLTHAPRKMHLALASRIDPRLPIVQLRAQNQVTEIRAYDLRFSAAEANDFLSKSLGSDLDDDVVRRIYKRSEGWITGLRLAVLSMRQFDNIDQFSELEYADDRFVIDYLLAEALSAQPEKIQAGLLKMAVLDRFCSDLCTALLDPADDSGMNGQAFVEYLTSHNLFVIPLDNQQTWYRFHHLFGHFLRQETRQRNGPSAIAKIHAQAAEWLAKNQLVEEALLHYRAAGEVAAAAQLVERNTRSLLDGDRWHVLENWMAQLPESIIQQRPALLLAKAWEAFHQFALPAIPSILEKVVTQLDDDPSRQPLWGEVDFFWGHHWYWGGQQSRSLHLLSQSLERIPKNHHLARGEAELFWGLAMQMSNQKEVAVQQLYRWLYAEQTMHPGRLTKLLGSLIFIHLLCGELPEARQVTQRVQAIGTEYEIPYIKAWASYLQAYIFYCQNDLQSAARYFSEAANSRYVLHNRAAIESLVGLAISRQVLGDEELAQTALQDLLEFAWETKNPSYLTIARTCQARLALLQGDPLAATHWLQAADLNHDGGILFYWLEIPRITQVRVLIAEGTAASLSKAADQLTGLVELASHTHNRAQMIELLILQVRLNQKQGRLADALAALNESLALARAGRWIRPFVEAGPELLHLFPQLTVTQIIQPFVQVLEQESRKEVHQVGLRGRRPDVTTLLADDLTYREREVLVLLAGGLSNQEIAAELTISTNTVKRHTGSLYRKLDVKNRRQAVTKAQKVGLLPPTNPI